MALTTPDPDWRYQGRREISFSNDHEGDLGEAKAIGFGEDAEMRPLFLFPLLFHYGNFTIRLYYSKANKIKS